MMDLANELGVQSYSFRYFKENQQVIDCLKQCGVSTVELCGVHTDFTDVDGFTAVADLYRRSGISIVSIGVQLFDGKETEERKYFECGKIAGFDTISASFGVGNFPANLELAEALAQEYDMKLAIHNHGGRDWLGSSTMLNHVFGRTGDRIGLCLDIAWAMDSGMDPIKMIRDFGPRLHGLHVKDFLFNPDRSFEETVAGEGNLDLAVMVSALQDVDFSGYAVIEYEENMENPVPAITRCVQAVRAAATA